MQRINALASSTMGSRVISLLRHAWGNIFRRLRYLDCRGLFDKSGVSINVEHGAYIGFAMAYPSETTLPRIMGITLCARSPQDTRLERITM